MLVVSRANGLAAQDDATTAEAPPAGAPTTETAPAEATPPAETAPTETAPVDAPPAEADTAASTPEASATTAVPTPPGERPKVAVVIAGDPEPELVAAARALSAVLLADEEVRLPSDAALRSALLGEGTDDGLDDVRASRRRLGRSELADVPVLADIGSVARAVLVIEVRADAEGIVAVAFDVGQQAFFDGALDLTSGVPANAGTFVARRARVAAEGAAASAEPVDAAEEAEAAAEEGEAARPGDPVLHWFEDNWAYLAAGALLAGGIAFVVVVATDSGPPQPMLRFTPGGPTR